MQPLALAMILSVARVSEWGAAPGPAASYPAGSGPRPGDVFLADRVSVAAQRAVEAGRRRVFTRTGPPVRGALVASRPMSREPLSAITRHPPEPATTPPRSSTTGGQSHTDPGRPATP